MDFRDSPEDAAFRAEARAWLESNVPAKPRRDAPSPTFSAHTPDDIERARKVQAKMADARMTGITWPVEYGGRGGTLMQHVIFDEEAAAYEVPTMIFGVGTGLAGPTIIAHGTEAQRARFLPPILRAEEVWCQLFSEPGAGSDLAGLRTRAVRDGDEWVVNGQKVWTSGAQIADWAIMPVRTDPSVPKHRGMTYFVVDMRTPGITVRPLRQMTGDAHFAEVFLDDARVPHENVLGAIGDGWKIINTTLMSERMTIGAVDLGSDRSHAIEFARQAQIDGRPAVEDSRVRQALTDIHIRSELLRFLRYRLLTALEQERAPVAEGSISKLAIADLMRRTGELVLELQGPAGTLTGEDAPVGGAWQAMFLCAPSFRILGGTDEIQRNILAERVLGLPREPDPGRELPFGELLGAPPG